jgi:CHAD domain-containing protein
MPLMSRNGESDFGLLSHLDELMGELHTNVPKALREFDPDGIHDARVATRRLKAALRLLEAVVSKDHAKAFDKVLRKVRRRLGPLRDLDVMIEHLGKLHGHPTHGTAADWLCQRLETQRQQERDDSRNGSGSADVLAKLGAWWHVREEICDAKEAIDCLLAESLHLQLDTFAEQAAGIVAQTTGGQSPTHRHDPHELRISGKLLRYTLELAKAQGHELPPAILKHFKAMQESLGNWHDDVVLVECAMQSSLGAMLSYHDQPMQEKVLELSKFFLRRANRELTNFASQWSKRGEDVARVIRERFPLTRPAAPDESANGSKKDPDPSGSDDTSTPAASAPVAASAG